MLRRVLPIFAFAAFAAQAQVPLEPGRQSPQLMVPAPAPSASTPAPVGGPQPPDPYEQRHGHAHAHLCDAQRCNAYCATREGGAGDLDKMRINLAQCGSYCMKDCN